MIRETSAAIAGVTTSSIAMLNDLATLVAVVIGILVSVASLVVSRMIFKKTKLELENERIKRQMLEKELKAGLTRDER